MLPLTTETVLHAYRLGYFPMAESRSDEEFLWVKPKQRGILPLDDRFHVTRNFRKFLRDNPFRLTVNQDFAGVINACSAVRTERPDSWINPMIRDLFIQLHEDGHAHSIEVWRDQNLVGGLYGLSLGSVFFGESMFSHESNASKTALVYLVGLLRLADYQLCDTQFLNDHLEQFGALAMPDEDYMPLLTAALAKDSQFPSSLGAADWVSPDGEISGKALLAATQSLTTIS